MKVLVTGQNGFVGTHFTHHVGAANVIAFPASIDLVDFSKTSEFVSAQKFDAVLHLAARASVSESFADPGKTKSVNVEGTRNLLRSLMQMGFGGSVLLVSSGEVYGAVDAGSLPVREDQPLSPRNPYAESKAEMETLVSAGGASRGAGEFADAPFTTVIARPFNHVGPGQTEHFVVASFTAQLARRKLGLESGPMKTGELGVTRDFTDVRDIVEAYAMLLRHGLKTEKTSQRASANSSAQVYNLGSGRETKLQHILETLIEISETNSKFEVDPARLRPNEQMRMCADISKITKAIGWKPRHGLKETLRDCFNAALATVAASK